MSVLFPDVVVACGIKWGVCRGLQAVSNPILIIEVLSKSTADKDRGKKFDEYKSIDSFREYLLVEQQTYSVSQYWKENDTWKEQHFDDLLDSISLGSVECVLSLAEIYRKMDQLGCA